MTTAGTGDTGKVLTPSGTSAGVSELRKLQGDELLATGDTDGSILVVASGALVITKAPKYGSYSYHNTDGLKTIVIAAKDTWYLINATAFTSDVLNGTTYSGGYLTMTSAGIYLVQTHACLLATTGTNVVFELDVAINGTPTGHPMSRLMASGTDVGQISTTNIITVTAGQTLSAWIRNTSGTEDVDIKNFSFDAIRIGVA
jgi:hypothetical protein